jgi:hypothetical protein
MDAATALDTAIDGLDAHATTGDAPMRRLLCARELPSPRFPGRHADLDLVERKRQAAEILEQATPRGSGRRGGIGTPLVVGAASRGGTQSENRQRGIDQQHVFARVACLLAALTARLLSRILGTLDAPFGAIMATRGEAGAGAGGSPGMGGSVVGTTSAVASASATPRRAANFVTDRVGASPRVRRVAGSTTKRTGIHCWAVRWPIPNSRPCTTWRG